MSVTKVNMCVTTQYFYCCWHPATRGFRNGVCPARKSQTCHVRHEHKMLTTMCRWCDSHDRSRPPFHLFAPDRSSDDVFNDTWYVPSRGFVDIGFRTLDPFKVQARLPNFVRNIRETPDRTAAEEAEGVDGSASQSRRINQLWQIEVEIQETRPSTPSIQARRRGPLEADRLDDCDARTRRRKFGDNRTSTV